MELIVEDSENQFADLLPFVQEEPQQWRCVHVNLARLHEEALNREGLSRELLEKIDGISLEVAQKILNMGISALEGKTFVFGDGDVIAVFMITHPDTEEVLRKLRHEFAQGVGHLFHSYSMKDRLEGLLKLSHRKRISAEDFRLKRQATEVVESIFQWTAPRPELSAAIAKKRRMRAGTVIVVIEDDLMVRGVVNSMLRKDYKVVPAKDAKSGIMAYIDNAPDVVLLDIHLPDVSGHEVLNRLKLVDPEAYVVMLSVDSAADSVKQARAEGAAGFIKKPFSKDRLLEMIKKCPSLSQDSRLKALGWNKVKRSL